MKSKPFKVYEAEGHPQLAGDDVEPYGGEHEAEQDRHQT
jgi:hypothetical protein